MAINKTLIYIKNKETFEQELAQGNILNTSIVFIEDSLEIYTHGKSYANFSNYLNAEQINNILKDYVTFQNLDALSLVALSGSYNDLSDKPSIPEKISELENDKNFISLETIGTGNKFLSDDGTFKELNNDTITLSVSNQLSFYCIEPVTVTIGNKVEEYAANSYVTIYPNDQEFIITPTSNNSILTLTSWPGTLNEFYPWLEGVRVFSNIIFNMNDLSMYEKWNQGHQGQYKVQFAQYKNCIFWSDNAYVSDVSKRPNYTLYYSSELPLCYSTIPENTFKSFYMAYNVTSDPNWSNPLYRDSFALATWATQVFSYYGLHSIGMFDMDSSEFNIVLPKDCRGLMFYAPNVLNAGIFDAINVTNFGAKSGSWRDAFAYCYQLTNLYIKNLKVNLNVSWSPISQQALEFILDNAANTTAITITISPFTYLRLTDSNKELAASKNIILELNDANSQELITYQQKQYIENLDTWDWAEL